MERISGLGCGEVALYSMVETGDCEKRLCCGCVVAVLWLCCGCVVAVLLLCCGCVVAVL